MELYTRIFMLIFDSVYISYCVSKILTEEETPFKILWFILLGIFVFNLILII